MHVALLWRVCLPGSRKRGCRRYILERTQSDPCSPDPFPGSSYFPLFSPTSLGWLWKVPCVPLLCVSWNSPFQKNFQEYDSEMSPLNQTSASSGCPGHTSSLSPRAPLIHRNLSVSPPGLPTSSRATLPTRKRWCGNSPKSNTALVNRGLVSLL